MSRIAVLLTMMVLLLGLTAGGALAMEPPGEPAQDNFGCYYDDEGELAEDPVLGHPGAHPGEDRGIDSATFRLEDKGFTMPTAWNAVEHAEPIEFGECPDADS